MLRRPRRNRKSDATRSHIKETRLTTDNLIYPIFILDGTGIKEEIKSMPGNFRWSLDMLLPEIGECLAVGIHTFVLFPAVADTLKDTYATYSYAEENFYLKAIATIKEKYPQVAIMTDVAMDPYSSDGHDGLVVNDEIVNDETLEILGKMAVAQAKAGADIIGPSDMMDGRIQYIREALDEAGFTNVSIMAYTAKYASAFYGPFRDALSSAPKKGDKKSYQMDPANKREALIEAELDYMEGADYMMVKPAIHYLDVIHLLKENYQVPIAAYHVSGECAMLIAACDNGWLDRNRAVEEAVLSIKRAGADVILTYFAKELALKWAK